MNNGKVVAICKWFNDRLEDWLAMHFYHNHSVKITEFYSQLEKISWKQRIVTYVYSAENALISRNFFLKFCEQFPEFPNRENVCNYSEMVKNIQILLVRWGFRRLQSIRLHFRSPKYYSAKFVHVIINNNDDNDSDYHEGKKGRARLKVIARKTLLPKGRSYRKSLRHFCV